ncbi:MAG: hypothetical protein PVG66_08075 [Chromatiales bacterium]|jgi:hypothetical protein
MMMYATPYWSLVLMFKSMPAVLLQSLPFVLTPALLLGGGHSMLCWLNLKQKGDC